MGNLGSFAVDSGWISCGFLGDARPFGHAGLPFSHPPTVDKVASVVGRRIGLGRKAPSRLPSVPETPHYSVSCVWVAAFVGFAVVGRS
jgi:hypothetical protein